MKNNFLIYDCSNEHALLNLISNTEFYALIEAHPQLGVYGRAYYPEYWGDSYVNTSFAVMDRGVPILVVQGGVINGSLGLYGLRGLEVHENPQTDQQVINGAYRHLFKHLNDLATTLRLKKIIIDDKTGNKLSNIGVFATNRDAKVRLKLNGLINLESGEVAWRASLRRSFIQFINWGKKNIDIRLVNAESSEWSLFEDYRLFHQKIAGRVTRSKQSWDLQLSRIKSSNGELILGYLDGKLVAGSLFMDGESISMYMNGVYERSLDKPLAHYLIWTGIHRAAARGNKVLQIGDIHMKRYTSDSKLYQIGYFKRGFATDIQVSLEWEIETQELVNS